VKDYKLRGANRIWKKQLTNDLTCSKKGGTNHRSRGGRGEAGKMTNRVAKRRFPQQRRVGGRGGQEKKKKKKSHQKPEEVSGKTLNQRGKWERKLQGSQKEGGRNMKGKETRGQAFPGRGKKLWGPGRKKR